MSRGADGIVRQSRLSVLPRILNPIEARAHESDLPPPEAFRSTDFSKTLWLPSRQIENTVCGMKEAGKLKIEFAKYTPNTTEIGYIAKEPAWLVLNEIHMPGWHVPRDVCPGRITSTEHRLQSSAVCSRRLASTSPASLFVATIRTMSPWVKREVLRCRSAAKSSKRKSRQSR